MEDASERRFEARYGLSLARFESEILANQDSNQDHPEIVSYPLDVHQQDVVHPSPTRSLSDVFDLIAKLLQD